MYFKYNLILSYLQNEQKFWDLFIYTSITLVTMFEKTEYKGYHKKRQNKTQKQPSSSIIRTSPPEVFCK